MNKFVRVHKLSGLILVASFAAYGLFGIAGVVNSSDRIVRVTRFIGFPAEPFRDPFWHPSTDVAPKSQDKVVDILFEIRNWQI